MWLHRQGGRQSTAGRAYAGCVPCLLCPGTRVGALCLQGDIERPGVKKEWGRQQTILPAPQVASRPQPTPGHAAPAAAAPADTASLAEAPVWPEGAAGSHPSRSEPLVAAPALPGLSVPLVEHAAADEGSDRLAFITQCLQVCPADISCCYQGAAADQKQKGFGHQGTDRSWSRCVVVQ